MAFRTEMYRTSSSRCEKTTTIRDPKEFRPIDTNRRSESAASSSTVRASGHSKPRRRQTEERRVSSGSPHSSSDRRWGSCRHYMHVMHIRQAAGLLEANDQVERPRYTAIFEAVYGSRPLEPIVSRPTAVAWESNAPRLQPFGFATPDRTPSSAQ